MKTETLTRTAIDLDPARSGKRDTGRREFTFEEDADGYIVAELVRIELHEDADGDWSEVSVRIGGGYFDTETEARTALLKLEARC